MIILFNFLRNSYIIRLLNINSEVVLKRIKVTKDTKVTYIHYKMYLFGAFWAYTIFVYSTTCMFVLNSFADIFSLKLTINVYCVRG